MVSNIFDAIDTLFAAVGPDVKNKEEMARYVLTQYSQWAPKLYDWIAKHPLLRRYAQYQRIENFSHTQPWQAQGEKLGVLAGLMNGILGVGSEYPSDLAPMMQSRFPDESDFLRQNNDALERVHLVGSLYMSKVYQWTVETFKEANALSIPRHVIARDQMPFPVCFFSLPVAYPLRTPAGDTEYETNFQLLIHRPEGIEIYRDITKAKGGSPYILGSFVPYGVVFPDDFDVDTVDAAQQLLGELAFLNSPATDLDNIDLPRPIRREIERLPNTRETSGGIKDLTTNVIRLRHVHTPRNEGGMSDVNWKSRWWVSGHIRAQWYPSLKAHKLIYIAPHIKGPAGMPLKETIYSVER